MTATYLLTNADLYGERVASKMTNKCCNSPRCRPLVLVLQDPWMRSFMKHMHQQKRLNAICIDATGQTNAYGFMLYAIIVPDANAGRGVPIAHMITSVDNHQTVRKMLDAVTQACGDYFKPKMVMIDKCDAESKGIREWDPEVEIVLCFFHVMQAWRRWLNRSNNGVKSMKADVIMRFIRAMKNAVTPAAFYEEKEILEAYLKGEQLGNVKNYLDSEWIGGK